VIYNKMVRTSKTTSATATASTPVVSVAIEIPAPVVAEKKARKAKAAAVEPAVVAPVVVPVVAPVVESASVVEPAAAEAVVDTTTKMTEFGAKITQIATLLASMKADYKVLEKSIARDLKNASKSKKSKKSSVPNPNRQLSGFVKPSVVSDDLLAFLGKEKGLMMSRVEVSKEITAYIEKNSLKDKDNGRQINPDAKLTKLLKVNEGEVLTYFNLQRYLKIHFIKAESA
jgi:upstream activation factor subunit UAF30